jgi:hypothetical protein
MVLQESLFVLQGSWRHANVVEEHSQRSLTLLLILLRELQTQLPILLRVSMNLREAFTP